MELDVTIWADTTVEVTMNDLSGNSVGIWMYSIKVGNLTVFLTEQQVLDLDRALFMVLTDRRFSESEG